METDALLGDFPHLCEGPDLEAAGVREHGLLPGGEIVEAAHLLDQLVSRAEPEVVGVAEDDLCPEFFEFRRMEGFHRTLRADGHEDGGFHLAVGKGQGAGAGGAVGGL